MNRVDRLFAILLILQKRKVIRAIDLAEQFELSERTVYRDISALIEMGVPIASLPGEGYELLDTFHLPPLMLSSDEAIALFLGGKMLIRNATGKITSDVELALKKIDGVLPQETKMRLDKLAEIIDFFPAQRPFDWDEPYLLLFMDAIESKQVVHIVYQAYMDASQSERDIEPHGLNYSDGAWYVSGYCRLRQDMRSFRLNRIIELTVKAETFQPRIMFPENVPTITIKVRFESTVLPHVKERQHYAFVEEQDDGVMVYHVHDLSEIQHWILGFGAQAKVLAPQVLKDWIIEQAQTLIKLLT